MAAMSEPPDAPVPALPPYPFAVSGLQQARALLLARIAGLDAERRALWRQVEAMEVSLRTLDPAVEIADERPLLRWRGPEPVETPGLTRSVIRALRLAADPLTNAEITLTAMQDQGHDTADRAYRTVVRQRVGVCLRKLRLRKLVRNVGDARVPAWELAR